MASRDSSTALSKLRVPHCSTPNSVQMWESVSEKRMKYYRYRYRCPHCDKIWSAIAPEDIDVRPASCSCCEEAVDINADEITEATEWEYQREGWI